MRILFTLLLIVWYTPHLLSQQIIKEKRLAKVAKVIDGDTIDVSEKDSTYRIRLFGIDAPEKGQEFFEESRNLLAALILNKEVIVQIIETDKYGRQVANLLRKTDDLNINYEMVKKGMAWHFTLYSSDTVLAHLQAMAREKEIGIWSLFHYLEPWEYRKNMQQ